MNALHTGLGNRHTAKMAGLGNFPAQFFTFCVMDNSVLNPSEVMEQVREHNYTWRTLEFVFFWSTQSSI